MVRYKLSLKESVGLDTARGMWLVMPLGMFTPGPYLVYSGFSSSSSSISLIDPVWPLKRIKVVTKYSIKQEFDECLISQNLRSLAVSKINSICFF